MSKQHLFLPILIYFSINTFAINVTVPDLGTIRGKVIKTVGNLNYEQKTYSTFRNIPYAESVSGSKRFSVRLWAQSFSTLMADLRKNINRVYSFSRCLNGTFP